MIRIAGLTTLLAISLATLFGVEAGLVSHFCALPGL